MNYKAELFVEGNPSDLYKLLKNEDIKTHRTECSIKKDKNGIIFNIVSKDSVALRATLNSITKLLTVYEKIDKMKLK